MSELAMPPTTRGGRRPAEQDFDLVVEGVVTIADGVVAVTLRGDGDLPEWTAGAHIDLRLGPDLIRQYSLCGDPSDRGSMTVAVLREPASRGGSERVHALSPGDVVPARGPRNNFELEPSPNYVFIAGGIGITPMLPMIRAAEGAGASWTLLYGGRTRTSMAFRDRLAEDHPDRVTVWPQDEEGLLDLPAALATPAPGTLVYCCGPEPLLAAVENTCRSWPAGALHLERFSARAEDIETRADDTPIEVEFRESGITVLIPTGVSILDAAAEARLPVDSSCQEGICGTCETPVLEGVPDHRDAVLTEAEREAGDTMMICCSRACGPRLVLDL
ncbi:MAG: PDR/VanB family oxidoreductase [Pseudonocardia sp.]|nr:PDR/VanB family oxidoreductase [Pseudonocardia sp.]